MARDASGFSNRHHLHFQSNLKLWKWPYGFPYSFVPLSSQLSRIILLAGTRLAFHSSGTCQFSPLVRFGLFIFIFCLLPSYYLVFFPSAVIFKRHRVRRGFYEIIQKFVGNWGSTLTSALVFSLLGLFNMTWSFYLQRISCIIPWTEKQLATFLKFCNVSRKKHWLWLKHLRHIHFQDKWIHEIRQPKPCDQFRKNI